VFTAGVVIVINCADDRQFGSFTTLNLFVAVCNYFHPKLLNKKIHVVGKAALINACTTQLAGASLSTQIIDTGGNCDEVFINAFTQRVHLADWIFFDAQVLSLETLMQLNEGAHSAVTVLIGPHECTLPAIQQQIVDFCVEPIEPTLTDDFCNAVITLADENSSLFIDAGQRYKLINTSAKRLSQLKQAIAVTAAQRTQLKAAMEKWYTEGTGARFPARRELEATDNYLSQLDTAYKRLWDANQ
jgi:uncharacterized protein